MFYEILTKAIQEARSINSHIGLLIADPDIQNCMSMYGPYDPEKFTLGTDKPYPYWIYDNGTEDLPQPDEASELGAGIVLIFTYGDVPVVHIKVDKTRFED